jgi:hypothetical protein
VRRLLLSLALLAGILIPASSVSTAAATPSHSPVTGIGIRLVDVPTAAAHDSRARSYIVDHLAPGQTIERRIEVVNHTRSETRVSMYAAAASVGKGGFVAAEGRSPNDVSRWTSVTPRSLTLRPQQQAFVKVTVRVPALAARGESYGVVWAEVTTPPKTPAGVTRVSRAGIRLYLSIGPGGAPPSDFTIESLTAIRGENNVAMVQASVHNTGERALDLRGTLTLSKGPGGLSAGPFPVSLGTTLAIGDTEPVLVPLDPQIPKGPWLATITLNSGLVTRTAHATLTFPSDLGTGPAVPAAGGPHLFGLIGILLLSALLFLLALTGLILHRRRNRRNIPMVVDSAAPR